MDKLSVIMPCWLINEDLQFLCKNAIESLGDVNLIIIDNASTQGGGYLRSVADVYVRNQTNLGYAKAVNQGLKLTTAPLVAVVNNDVIASPNWQEVVRDIADEKKVGSIHLRMTDYDVPFEYGDKIIKTGKERWCQGSFFVLKKPFILYDENYLNSYDDWDYFYRIRQQGLFTVYTDKACFQHRHSSSQIYIPEREENNNKNREYFKKKHGQYAEDIFAEKYPEQMKEDYERGWDI